MPMPAAELEAHLRHAFPDASITIEDLAAMATTIGPELRHRRLPDSRACGNTNLSMPH